jgi:hypothetical protein
MRAGFPLDAMAVDVGAANRIALKNIGTETGKV